MIPVFVAEFSGYRAVVSAEISKREDLIVEVEEAESALIKPIVSGMIDNNIENYADWKGMAVLLEIMCGVDQIDQILLGAEMGINAR